MTRPHKGLGQESGLTSTFRPNQGSSILRAIFGQNGGQMVSLKKWSFFKDDSFLRGLVPAKMGLFQK